MKFRSPMHRAAPSRRALLLASVLSVATSQSLAQSAATQGQEGALAANPSAEAYLARGLELRRAGRDEEAAAEFGRAYALTHEPRASAQWGLALQAAGRWVPAYERISAALGASNDPWVRRNAAALESALRVVRTRVGLLEVSGAPAGAEVAIDGEVRGRLPMAAPIAVRTGEAQLEVRAPGYAPRRVRLVVEAEARLRERVDLLRLDEAPNAGGGGNVTAFRVLQLVSGVVAVGGVAMMGVGFALRESSAVAFNEAVLRGDAGCPEGIPPNVMQLSGTCRSLFDQEASMGALGWAGVPVAAVGVAGVIVSSVLAASRSTDRPTSVPAVSVSVRDGLGLGLSGAF